MGLWNPPQGGIWNRDPWSGKQSDEDHYTMPLPLFNWILLEVARIRDRPRSLQTSWSRQRWRWQWVVRIGWTTQKQRTREWNRDQWQNQPQRGWPFLLTSRPKLGQIAVKKTKIIFRCCINAEILSFVLETSQNDSFSECSKMFQRQDAF